MMSGGSVIHLRFLKLLWFNTTIFITICQIIGKPYIFKLFLYISNHKYEKAYDIYLFSGIYLISFNIIIFTCLHFVENPGFHSLLWLSNIPSCIIQHILFIQPSVDEYLGWSHSLAIMNWVAIKMEVQITLLYVDFNSFGCICWDGTA